MFSQPISLTRERARLEPEIILFKGNSHSIRATKTGVSGFEDSKEESQKRLHKSRAKNVR